MFCRGMCPITFAIPASVQGGFTALHYAARGGHVDVVKFLLKLPRVDPNAREYTVSGERACSSSPLRAQF